MESLFDKNLALGMHPQCSGSCEGLQNIKKLLYFTVTVSTNVKQ